MASSNKAKGYNSVKKKSAVNKPKVKGGHIHSGKPRVPKTPSGKPVLNEKQIEKVVEVLSANPFDADQDRAYWDSMALIGAVLVAAVGSAVVAVVLLSKIV